MRVVKTGKFKFIDEPYKIKIFNGKESDFSK